jgi:hypothetical protein
MLPVSNRFTALQVAWPASQARVHVSTVGSLPCLGTGKKSLILRGSRLIGWLA